MHGMPHYTKNTSYPPPSPITVNIKNHKSHVVIHWVEQLPHPKKYLLNFFVPKKEIVCISV